jgi:hypothetical protein
MNPIYPHIGLSHSCRYPSNYVVRGASFPHFFVFVPRDKNSLDRVVRFQTFFFVFVFFLWGIDKRDVITWDLATIISC